MVDFNENTVYILDSYGLIFRCYFAFINRPLTNPQGDNISALFGFFRNLHFILEHYKPGYIFAAMDSKTKTFRHEFYPEYKATRNKTPEDLHAQIPWISEILEKLGIPVLQCDGYEADDIIATVAKKCQESGRTCRILSGDKDLMQLVCDTTQILKPDAGSAWKITGIEGVEAEWGVKPEQLLDLLSLYGDTADNIPGVHGVGVKTAAKLLSDYKDLDGIYAHIDQVKGAMQKKLIDGKENAYFSQKLVRLCDTVPCSQIEDALNNKSNYHFAEASKLLAQYGAFQVAKQYNELALKNGEKIQEGESLPLGSATENSASSPTPSSGDTPQRPLHSTYKDFFVENAVELSKIKKNSGNYSAIKDIPTLKDFVDKAIQAGKIAFDCETDSLDTINANILGFSLCYQAGSAVYIPLSSGQNLFEADNLSKEEAFSELKRIFECQNLTIIMHNGKFDLKVLASNGLFANKKITFKAKLFDTMISAWLINPERNGRNSYSLEGLSELLLGLKGIEFSDIVAKGQTFSDVPLENAVPYASEDADFTLQLWQKLSPELDNQEYPLKNLFEIEMTLLPILANMELAGVHLDSQELNQYNQELSQGIKKAEEAIYKEVGHEFNIASPKQLQTVLFEERKLKPGKKTKTGYSTDTSVLEELAMYDSVPKMILEYREMAKLQSTYVETLPKLTDSQNRIHTDFVQTGTATGRLSCREPNLQNIPVRNEAGRRIRSAFTASDGKVLISADYAQIELVVLAHLSGDKNMSDAFINGTDVHKSTAALIYGVKPEEVTPEMRRTAKTINFGVIYGMSAFRLAQDLGISRTEASQFIENYDRHYADITRFKVETIAKAEDKGYVETIFGRRRPIININSRNKIEKAAAERIAINTPVQGSAADIVKKAMIEVSKALEEKQNGARLLLQVHDELILECPEEPAIVEETVQIIRDKMENAVKLNVPLRVSIEQGKSWGLFH
ncbi:MAG: DNA polymerase I [Treponema sp.]|nr:DNA polymerase I [Treponema sp.]